MANNSAMDTIKGLLGDNADEKIKAALSTLSKGGDSSGGLEPAEQSEPSAPRSSGGLADVLDEGTLDSLMQIKGIVDNLTNSRNDSRSNLLMSLKPYMRTTRQGSIDTVIRMLNLSKLTGIFRMR
ncbi:MAG: hypothetical protein J6N52_12615 [Clostridia bacterium]|nr:hypothetical protein [Clostridia bacterium]